jgi:hypothetical protein
MGKSRLTSLTIAQIGNPQVFMVRIYQSNEGSRAVHVQTRLSVVLSSGVMIIDYSPDVLIRIVGQAFHTAEEVQNVSGDGFVEVGDAF